MKDISTMVAMAQIECSISNYNCKINELDRDITRHIRLFESQNHLRNMEFINELKEFQNKLTNEITKLNKYEMQAIGLKEMEYVWQIEKCKSHGINIMNKINEYML